MPKIVDRRSKALGGQKYDRSINVITNIGIHYTATTNSHIANHENWWKNGRGWGKGGYLFWIDRDGTIYQNYNYTRITYGASGWNRTTAHFSIEASHPSNYTKEQIESMYWLIQKMLKDLPNTSPSRIYGHWEMTNSTACPGWSRSQLNAIRSNVRNGKGGSVPAPKPTSTSSKTVDKIAQEVIAGKWRTGHERMTLLRNAGYNPQQIQSRVNEILLGGSSTSSPKKPNSVIAQEVINGHWGNGDDRKRRLNNAGYNYSGIQNEVNRILGGQHKAPNKTVQQLAQEVIDGKWGNGKERKNRLNKAGHNASAVQSEVNRILGTPSRGKSINHMAKEVINGDHGNGHETRRRSLGISQAEYRKVRARVNQLV